MKTEVVNPYHYTANGKECIVEMYEQFGAQKVIAFCELNAFKYAYRKDHKGQSEADALKADWYKSVQLLLESGFDIHTTLERVRKA